MVKFTVQAETKVLERVQSQLDALPEQIQRAVDRTTQTADNVRAEIAKQPGPVRYPIQWTSERQRRAFFATNGFGSGIPYRRTGGLGRAWNLTSTRTSNGAVLVLENRNETAKYVYGFFGQVQPQQKFHANTGWKTANSESLRIRSLLYEEVFVQIVAELAKVGKI